MNGCCGTSNTSVCLYSYVSMSELLVGLIKYFAFYNDDASISR